MVNLAICDDNLIELHTIHAMANCFLTQRPGLVLNCVLFHSPVEFVSRVEAGWLPDIVLMDILMPEMDGIRAGRAMRIAGGAGVLIYLTSSTGHALDAYGVHAFRYLLKPVDPALLYSALDDALALIHQEGAASLPVRLGEEIQRVRFCDILYVECVRHVHKFHLTNQMVLSSNNSRNSFFTDMAPLLEDQRFFSPHRSFIVNMAHMNRLSADGAHMADGSIVPVPRAKYTETKRRYLAFLAEQGNLVGARLW